jgi:hypothetical protein
VFGEGRQRRAEVVSEPAQRVRVGEDQGERPDVGRDGAPPLRRTSRCQRVDGEPERELSLVVLGLGVLAVRDPPLPHRAVAAETQDVLTTVTGDVVVDQVDVGDGDPSPARGRDALQLRRVHLQAVLTDVGEGLVVDLVHDPQRAEQAQHRPMVGPAEVVEILVELGVEPLAGYPRVDQAELDDPVDRLPHGPG